MSEVVRFPRQGSNYTALPRGKQGDGVLAHAVQTIAASPDEVFRVYSSVELLHTWQEGVVSVVEGTDTRHLHWVMADPATGKQVEFDSEVLESTPGERHVSRIVNGPFAGTTDTVTFKQHPHGRGTVVTMISDYKLPGGAVTHAVAAVASRSPEQVTIENLRHLKQLIESGQIPSVEGQPSGPRGVTGKWKRFLMGENMPTPPGTNDRAKPQDMPRGLLESHDQNAFMLGSIAVLAGAAAWYGISKLRD